MEMTNRECNLIGVPLFIGMITIGALTLFIAIGAVETAFWWSLALSVGCTVGFLWVVWADRRASLQRATGTLSGVPMERIAPEDPRVSIDGPHGYRTTLEKPRER